MSFNGSPSARTTASTVRPDHMRNASQAMKTPTTNLDPIPSKTTTWNPPLSWSDEAESSETSDTMTDEVTTSTTIKTTYSGDSSSRSASSRTSLAGASSQGDAASVPPAASTATVLSSEHRDTPGHFVVSSYDGRQWHSDVQSAGDGSSTTRSASHGKPAKIAC